MSGYWIVTVIVAVATLIVNRSSHPYQWPKFEDYLGAVLAGAFWPIAVPLVLYYCYGKRKP